MKKLLSTMAVSFIAIFVFAEDKRIEIEDSKIKDVTVYVTGAQVNRDFKVDLEAGKQIIELKELTQYIDPNSIQVAGNGSFTILSVNHKGVNQNDREKPEEITLLEDSIKSIDRKVNYHNQRIKIVDEEWKMILSNNKVDWSKLGFAIEDLEDLSDFYRERLEEILDVKMDIQEKNRVLSITKSDLRNELNEIVKKWKRNTSSIEVELVAKSKGNATIGVSYFTPNAGWQPTYNLKVTKINNPVELAYNSKVWQSTQVDWEDVKITLSTSNPYQNTAKPELYPWWVDFFNYQPQYSNTRFKLESAGVANLDMDDSPEEAKSTTAASYVAVSENMLNVNFAINLPYNIPADGLHHTVNIRNENIKSTYQYYAAPKLSQNAYLVASMTDWEKLNLLPGQANLYLENTYIGKSYINPSVTERELEHSFGVDKRIAVKRELIKDYSSEKVLGNNKRKTIGYKITVRNNKKEAISIQVEDQIPVSKNSDIEVSLEEDSEGNLDKDKGYLSWDLELKPGESKELIVKYEVKFPKDKDVRL